MGSYDYSQPTPTQSSPNPDWFDQMPAGSMPPGAPKSNSKRKFILIVASAVFLVIALIVTVLSATIFAAPRCLNSDDYRALTGST